MSKSPPRFFASGPFREGGIVELGPDERRHARARRLREGDRVRLLDGAGAAAEGRIASFGANRFTVLTERLLETDDEPPASLSLYVTAVKLPRLAWLVEKATELGATRIVLARSGRAQGQRVRMAEEHRTRLSRVAREAAKQCGRSQVPRCEGPAEFESVLEDGSAIRILLDPAGEGFPDSLAPLSSALWVGPEGGFSSEEISRAKAAGWRTARIPAHTLRAETASLAGLTLLRRAFDTALRGAQNTTEEKS